MTAVEYILDGLEAALELERELGRRTVELDRSLLEARQNPASASASAPVAPPARAPAPPPRRPAPVARAAAEPLARTYDFVFLHNRPLSPAGGEMMSKIVAAMKATRETAPVVCAGERPPAKVSIVLGKLALEKWFPGLRAAPGQWLRGPNGESVLVTYSPEYILRFGTVSPAVKKLKLDMWTSLKAVMQRVRAGSR